MWRIRIYNVLTVVAFGMLYIFTAVMIIIGIPFLFLKMKTAVQFLMRFWAKSIFFLMGKKFHIKGLNNIKKDGRYILIANHSSLFDIIAIISFFHRVIVVRT